MKKRSTLNFIFFGEDIFSLVVLKSLVDSPYQLNPLAVIMLEPISVSGRRVISYCSDQGIPLITTASVNAPDFISRLRKLEFDLLVSAHFQRILPKSIFSRAHVGALNLHPSLLPMYRGMAPQHWPIIFGDTETGVTVHLIEDSVDCGPIINQVRVPLTPSIYIHELQKLFLEIYKTVMVEAVGRLIEGYRGIPQGVGASSNSYFHKVQELDMEITLETDLKHAFGLIRAFSLPYAGAKFGNLRIMKAKIVDAFVWSELSKGQPNLGLRIRDGAHYLFLKDGALELTKWVEV